MGRTVVRSSPGKILHIYRRVLRSIVGSMSASWCRWCSTRRATILARLLWAAKPLISGMAPRGAAAWETLWCRPGFRSRHRMGDSALRRRWWETSSLPRATSATFAATDDSVAVPAWSSSRATRREASPWRQATVSAPLGRFSVLPLEMRYCSGWRAGTPSRPNSNLCRSGRLALRHPKAPPRWWRRRSGWVFRHARGRAGLSLPASDSGWAMRWVGPPSATCWA